MTKIQEWEKMIECVENDSVSKEEILTFLKANKPKGRETIKRLPCICGYQGSEKAAWQNMATNKYFFRCNNCYRQSEEAKTIIQAKRNWNEMIKKETDDNGSEN